MKDIADDYNTCMNDLRNVSDKLDEEYGFILSGSPNLLKNIHSHLSSNEIENIIKDKTLVDAIHVLSSYYKVLGRMYENPETTYRVMTYLR